MEWPRCAKDILHPIIPSDPVEPQSIALAIVITKGRWKTDSTKRDKSRWDHIDIAYEKMKKSSRSGSRPSFGLGRGSGSGSGSQESGTCVPKSRGRGCNRGQSLASQLLARLPMFVPQFH